MASSKTAASDAVQPEDRELYEKLAKLQDINAQIFELRALLPDKLINPTRALLEAPGRFAPEKLAAHLKDAAIKGSKDIQRFKKEYQSDAMRELWAETNAADFPQGQDVWTVDYAALAKFNKSDKPTETGSNSNSTESSENEAEIFQNFRKEHPSIHIEVHAESEPLPTNITVSGITFRIAKGSTEDSSYEVLLSAQQRTDVLSKEVLQQLQTKSGTLKLADLLSLIKSYENVKSLPCDRCKNVFDSDIKLPLVREQSPSAESQQNSWIRLHQSCVT